MSGQSRASQPAMACSSRPLKQELGRYIFFADLEGHESDEAIVSALAAVGTHVDTLRVLGSYPAG